MVETLGSQCSSKVHVRISKSGIYFDRATCFLDGTVVSPQTSENIGCCRPMQRRKWIEFQCPLGLRLSVGALSGRYQVNGMSGVSKRHHRVTAGLAAFRTGSAGSQRSGVDGRTGLSRGAPGLYDGGSPMMREKLPLARHRPQCRDADRVCTDKTDK